MKKELEKDVKTRTGRTNIKGKEKSEKKGEPKKTDRRRAPPKLPDHFSKGYVAFLLLLAALTYLLATGIAMYLASRPIAVLSRPETGEEAAETSVIYSQAGEKKELTLTIPARQRSDEEIKDLLAAAKKEISEGLKGENESLTRVTKPLYMPDTDSQGLVSVLYAWDPPDYLSYEGEIAYENIPEEGGSLVMEIELSLEGETLSWQEAMTLYPAADPEGTEAIKEEVNAANPDASKEAYYLPEQIKDSPVTWYPSLKNPAALLAFLCLLMGMLIPLREQEKKKTETKKYKDALLLAYPRLVSQTMLFMGAGMGIREVLQGLSLPDQTGKRDPLAELCHGFCLDTAQGVGEYRALEHMGEKSGLIAYRTFVSMLAQNMKKGNAYLLPMLKAESEKAFAERQRQARILGSEAGTKLLLPMMLMLFVVLVLVLYPALLSF